MCYTGYTMRISKFSVQPQAQPLLQPQTLRGSVTIAGEKVAVSAEAVPRSSSGTAPAEAVTKLYRAAKKGIFSPPAWPIDQYAG